MTRLREKAQGQTKQLIGQFVGDDLLVQEGKQQVHDAEAEAGGNASDHGIVKDDKAQEQPKDKQRAQTAHTTGTDNSVSREKTRDAK